MLSDWLRARVTFANVVSLIAVFLALGTGIAIAHNGSGAAAKILGYARVKANGAVVTLQSKNIPAHDVGVSVPGVYCFNHLPFRANGAQATIQETNVLSEGAHVVLRKGSTDCLPTGTDYQVVTSDQAGSRTPEPFYIMFYKWRPAVPVT